MVSSSAVVGIALVALGLVVTPGPNMVYLVSRSVTQGRRAGLISLLGVAAGFGVYLVAATAGIATIFALVPAVYTAVKLAGAAYLLWLAWKTVRPRGESVFAPKPMPADPPRRLFTMGLVTNLLTQICVALTVNAMIVLSAGGVSTFLARRPAWLRVQRYVMGTALAGLAVRIAADRSRAVAATP